MWCVYLIQHTISKQFYFGVTDDLKRRINEHNRSGKKFTTRKNGSWILIYAEAYRAEDDAIDRELKLKHHGSAKHELYKRLKKSCLLPKLGLDATKDPRRLFIKNTGPCKLSKRKYRG